MTRTFDPSIVVCICTYRRDSLVDALRSLDGTRAGLPVSLLVIDNDDTPTARSMTEGVAATSNLPVSYVHCPGANISIARNAALEHARARYLAFLDDDEVAGPDWVAQLERRMTESGAAVVLGPVQAVYEDEGPSWMAQADVHSTAPVFVGGDIRTGYSCNVLIDRQHAGFDGLRFRVDLGRSGGEDTAFFTEAFERGARIAFAPEAVVFEPVPAARARFAWLAKRRYRMGQTHGRLLLRDASPLARMHSAALSVAKLAYCAVAALLTVFQPVKRNRAILRGCLHAGTFSAHLGQRPLELYGQSKKGVTP